MDSKFTEMHNLLVQNYITVKGVVYLRSFKKSNFFFDYFESRHYKEHALWRIYSKTCWFKYYRPHYLSLNAFSRK